MFVSILFLLLLNFGSGFGKACSSDRKPTAEAVLREKLFCNYDRNIRPVKHFSNQTVVYIELYPLTIYMDEVQEKVTVHGNIQYVWSDSFIQWDPKEYEDIKMLNVVDEEIWTPEITIASSTDEMKLRTNTGDCLVSSVGKVLCFPVNTINAYCSPDLLRFPFDKQNCSFILLAPTYSGNHLNLNIYESGVKMSLYRPNKVWDIINITLKQEVALYGFEDNSTFYPYLTCNILIQRHSASHEAIIILPGLVLAGLTLLTFLMYDMHSSRMAIAGITFMSNLLYCLSFGYYLPSNGSQVPLIVTFFRDSLIISAFAIAAAIIVNHLQKITYPPYNWLSGFMSKLGVSPFGKVFFKDSYTVDDDSAEIIQDTKKKPSAWAQLAAFIDRTMLFICSFVYIILFLFFLP